MFAQNCRDGVHMPVVDHIRLSDRMSKEREKMLLACHLEEQENNTQSGTIFSRISEVQ